MRNQKIKSLDEIRELLDAPMPEAAWVENYLDYEENLPEDRLIIQPDGSRACISYELAGRGFHLYTPNFILRTKG